MPRLLLIATDEARAGEAVAGIPPGWELQRAPVPGAVDDASPTSIAAAFAEIDRLAAENPPRAALVAGEGDFTFAAAVGLVKLHVPVAAVEAGELAARVADVQLEGTSADALRAWLERVADLD